MALSLKILHVRGITDLFRSLDEDYFSFIECLFCFLPPQEMYFINIGLFVKIFCAVKNNEIKRNSLLF